MTQNDQLPVGLWLEAHLRTLETQCKPYYIVQKGDRSTGIVLVKIDDMAGTCRLLIQQRNFITDKLEWIPALAQEHIASADADAYIKRAISRDPDMWVIEIEDREKQNPFEDVK